MIEKKLRAHFRREGYRLDDSREKIERRLQSLMGAQRFEAYLKASDRHLAGYGSIKDRYSLMCTAEEAHVLMSLQGQPMLKASAAAYEAAADSITDGSYVLELGCYTGALSRWIAQRHQSCTIQAIDRIQLVKEIQPDDPPNLRRICCGYEDAHNHLIKAQTLVGVFPIDYAVIPAAHDRPGTLEPASPRMERRYDEYKTSSLSALKSWLRCSEDHAHLVVVMRLGCTSSFAGVVDAAAEAGWQVDLSRSTKVVSRDEKFPLLTFWQSRSPSRLSDNAIIDWFEGPALLPKIGVELGGWNAFRAYHLLENRHSLSVVERTYDDGHTAQSTVGRCSTPQGERSFRFRTATNGAIWLLLGELTEELDLGL